MKGKYIQSMKCNNCGNKFDQDFDMGTKCDGNNNFCPRCGCASAWSTGVSEYEELIKAGAHLIN